MKKENVLKIFRMLYLIWTFIYVVVVFSYIIDPIVKIESTEFSYRSHIIDYINVVFLILGVYYMFKYFSQKQ